MLYYVISLFAFAENAYDDDFCVFRVGEEDGTLKQ